MTATGEFAGTPFYVSPEQAQSREVDHRTDVFSLGVTLYELLTLRRPFPGDTTAEVLAAIVRREPEDPSRLNRALAKMREGIEPDGHARVDP
jgi:serine/threonine protein kinase